MLLLFILIIFAGHFYVVCIVLLLNIGIFKEIISLKRNYEKENKIPLFSFINWYFFSVAVFLFYGKLFSSKLSRVVWEPSNHIAYFIMAYHNILSFMLWIAGFLIFVLSLKQGYYRYQFRIFGWTHITLVLVVAQSSVLILNAYEGTLSTPR
jgi:phosphatidate cytidylyltransferase